MLYLDASTLVAAMTREARTADVQAWLRSTRQSDLRFSVWAMAEFSSALSLKLRRGDITVSVRDEAAAAFHRYGSESLIRLPVRSRHFLTAAAFTGRHETGLRAGDALHMAIAQDHGATVVTLDRTMADAGPMLGVSTLLL